MLLYNNTGRSQDFIASVKIRSTSLSSWFLICLLLAGQVSLLIHEADHANLAANSPCVVCVNNSVFNGPSTAPEIIIAVAYSVVHFHHDHASPVLSRYLLPATGPRAPPVYS